MIVAVDIRFAEEDYRNFIHQILNRISKQHPQHIFAFIIDETYEPPLISSQNIIPIVIKKAKIPLLSQVVADKRVANVLKKYKADVFVTPILLSSTNIPQCLIIDKNVSVKAMAKTKAIVTTSAAFKNNLIKKYNIEEGKIKVVHPGVDEEFQPIVFTQREKLKDQYTDGNEYFLYKDENASLDELLNLLKAFSIFKKRQKSSMQLLFASTFEFKRAFLEQLDLYKFKSDVKILARLSKRELAKITAGAYAAIYFTNANTFYFSNLEAINCDVPVITSNASVLREICGDAALYANADDNKDTAEKMMLIFKDEKLRRALIEKGKLKIKKFSWDITAEQLWEGVVKAKT